MNKIEFFSEESQAHERAMHHISLAEIFRMARRQIGVIIWCTLGFLAVAIGYVATADRYFTGEATLLIDPRRVQLFRQDSVTSDLAFDSSTLDSQLETLRSEKIALAVVRSLNLSQDPEFIGEPPSPISATIRTIISFFDPPNPDTEEARIRRAVNEYKKRMDIRRSGLSYAITIKATARSAGKAARIANETAEAYILDQIESRFELTQRASIWLQGRISNLSQEASEAERAAADFRANNQIVDANGRLISEVQLQEAQTQEGVARQIRQEAKARLDRLREISNSGLIDASVADALKSEILTRLRQEFLEISRRESDWSARFGANHQTVLQLRGDLRRLERSMQEEFKRIEQSHQSEYQIALAKEAAVQNEIERLKGLWNETRQAQVTLKTLESKASSLRTLHDTFVQRYILAVQQQSFPISDGRVITAASPPSRPSWPRPLIMVAAAIVLGGGVGCAIALYREVSDDRLWTTEELGTISGVDCIGLVPTEEAKGTAETPLARISPTAPPDGRVPSFDLPSTQPMLSVAIRQPFGLLAETCRNTKVSIDVARMMRPLRTIGITSPGPSEGKTTFAINLGLTIARSGGRVLVIDADLRKPRLTRSLIPDAQKGLVDVLKGTTRFEDVLWRERVSGCYFVPTVLTLKISNTSDMLNSKAMQDLLAQASDSFDYVIVDCPPVNPLADVRSFAHMIDSFVLIAAWGKTKRIAVERVAHADYLRKKLLGTVMTHVDLKVHKLFDRYDYAYYNTDQMRTRSLS